MNRYIAAVDSAGVISTGHAALEMQDIYISLYPAVDIDRSPSEFFAHSGPYGRIMYPENFRTVTHQSPPHGVKPTDRFVFILSTRYRSGHSLHTIAAEEIYNLTAKLLQQCGIRT